MHDGRMGMCMHKMLKECSGRTLGSTHESCISGLYFSRDVARPSCMHRRVTRGLQKAATWGSRSAALQQQAVHPTRHVHLQANCNGECLAGMCAATN